MFCVIQKVKNKKPNKYGAHKEIVVTETSFGFVGQEQKTRYGYTYSNERFERPILDAYKISIHHSYRENGKVKKKQWSICTMSYYNVIEFNVEEMVVEAELEAKVAEMGISKDNLYKMIYGKLNPIEEKIRAEFERSEEYRAYQEHQAILSTYRKVKAEFEKLYGEDTYDFIYDVYGNLRNKECLEKVITNKDFEEARRKEQEAHQRRSQEESYKRFEEYFRNSGSSSYSTNSHSNYNEEEKKMLHEIYRIASKKFHPDVSGDDGSKMKFLTKLKEQWGL